MPRQASGLKKYRCGTFCVSKISDNEHATATLGDSEVLSVENAVSEPIPEFAQRPEEGSKRPPSVNRQNAWDVFPDNPRRPDALREREELKGEVSARVGKSGSRSCEGEGLAGCPPNQKVNLSNVVWSDLCEVAEVRDLGIVVCENRTRKRVDVRKRYGRPPEWCPGSASRFDARTNT
jgi:hypothetical protein